MMQSTDWLRTGPRLCSHTCFEYTWKFWFKAMDQGGIEKSFLINFLATLQHETLTHKPLINITFNMCSRA